MRRRLAAPARKMRRLAARNREYCEPGGHFAIHSCAPGPAGPLLAQDRESREGAQHGEGARLCPGGKSALAARRGLAVPGKPRGAGQARAAASATSPAPPVGHRRRPRPPAPFVRGAQIKFLLVVSRQGKVRLAKWYQRVRPKERIRIRREVTAMVLSRPGKLCNFLEWRDDKIVYRR